MKRFIAAFLIVSILFQTIVSAMDRPLISTELNKLETIYDPLSQSTDDVIGDIQDNTITFANITDEEIFFNLDISQEKYTEASFILNVLKDKYDNRELQYDLLKIISDGFFTVEESERIYEMLPDRELREKELIRYGSFAALFNIADEVNDNRLQNTPFVSINTFSFDSATAIPAYTNGIYLPETFTSVESTLTDNTVNAYYTYVAKQKHLEMTNSEAYHIAKTLFLQGNSIQTIENIFYSAAASNYSVSEFVSSLENSVIAENHRLTDLEESIGQAEQQDSISQLRAGAAIMTMSESDDHTDDAIYSPYIIDINSNESINLQYGDFTFEQNILSIPGRNGMDLNFTIKYDTSRANWGIYNASHCDVTKEWDCFNIGCGWYFDLPHLYSQDDVIYIPDWGSFNYAVIQSEFDPDRYRYGGRPKGYQYFDVYLEIPQEDISLNQPAGIETPAKLAVHTDNGMSYYFDNTICLGISDRFGNIIQFEYDYIDCFGQKLLTEITDTNGNIIVLEYDSPETDRFTVTITSPDNNTFTLYISKHSLPNNSFCYTLDSFTNQNGETTSFVYNISAEEYSYHWDSSNAEDTNYSVLISEITYPTALKAVYTYQAITNFISPTDGMTNRTQVLSSRAYLDGTTEYGKINFEYFGNCPEPERPYKEYATVVLNNGLKKDYRFYGSARSVEKTFDSSGTLLQTSECSYQGKNIKKMTVTKGLTKTVVLDHSYKSSHNLSNEYSSKAEGSHTEETRHYGVFYTYDNTEWSWNSKKPLNILSSYSYYSQDNTKITVQNELDSMKRVIKTETVTPTDDVLSCTEYAYDDYGNITNIKQYRDPLHAPQDCIETQITYQSGTKPASITVTGVKDADGNPVGGTGIVTEQYTYDVLWRLSSATDGSGNTTTYTYDPTGRLTSVTFPNGETQIYSYNTALNQTVYTDRAENTYTYQFTKYGLLDMVTAPNGTVLLNNVYDLRGRLIETENAAGFSSYSKTTYDYDELDRIVKKGVYNSANQQQSCEIYQYEMDTDTYTIYFNESKSMGYKKVYNKHGELTDEYKLASGGVTADRITYEYDHLNRLTKEEKYGISNTYEYDALGNLLTATDISGNETSYTYDGLGRLTSATDARGYTTTYRYDALNRLIEQQTPVEVLADGTVAYSVQKRYYDNNGNVTKISVSCGLPGAEETFCDTLYTYDNMNRLTGAQTGNIVSTYTYNALDAVTSQTVGGSTTTYTYDNIGNLTAVTDPLGQSESYLYDANRFITGKTDRDNNYFSYTYDALGRNVSESVIADDEMASTLANRTYVYDTVGNLTAQTENGTSLTYTYDSLNRLASVSDGNTVTSAGETQAITQTYTYVPNTSVVQRHRLMQGDNAAIISTEYIYDTAGRLSQLKEDGNVVAAYEYDAVGNNTKITYNNGRITERTFTPSRQIKTQTLRSGNAVLYTETNTYRLDGNLASRTYTMNGKTTVDTFDYDGAGMLVGESRVKNGENQYAYTFAYDNRGNRTSLSDSVSGESTTYAYDLNNRLLTTDKSYITPNAYKETTNYYYDPNGNTVASVMETSDTYHSFTGNYHIAEITDSYGSLLDGFEFTQYEYDAYNRLTAVKNGSCEASYTYNPDGLRRTKTVITDNVEKTSAFVWDGSEIVVELDKNYDVVRNKYIYGLDRVLCEGPYSRNSYYQQNSHGDTVVLTGETGATYSTYEYDAFGNTTDAQVFYLHLDDETVWSAAPENPFRYCGEYFDNETETYYLRARYYNPALGRFTTEDTHWNTDNMIYGDNPVKINERENPYNPYKKTTFAYLPDMAAVLQSGNAYNYCLNSPLYYIDNSGEFAITLSSALVAALIAVCGIVSCYVAETTNVLLSTYSISDDAIKYNLNSALSDSIKLLAMASTAATPPPPNDPKSKGTQTNSKTLYNKDGIRIDVENPGNRIGQIHVQQGSDKFIYDVASQSFRTVSGDLAPKAIQKLLENPDVIKAVSKGLIYLGY